MKRLVLISVVAALVLLPPVATAGMDVMEDCELAGVNAKGGISTMISGFMLTGTNEIIIFDSDPATIDGHIRFENLAIFRLMPDWSWQPINIGSVADPMKMDVGTDTLGRSLISFEYPATVADPFTVRFGAVHFAGVNLSYAFLRDIDLRGSHIYLASRAGDQGVDLALGQQSNIGEIVWNYKTGDWFVVNNIHFSETAGGTITNPATWTFTGPFRLGRLFHPATNAPVDFPLRLDVDGGRIRLSLTGGGFSHGYIRIENISFGGDSFGPSIIDDVRIHQLEIRIPGG